MASQRWTARRAEEILIAIFLAVISLPLVGFCLGWKMEANLQEKRELAEQPVFGRDRLDELPGKIDRYYTDHFTFRGPLIRGHNEIKHRYLGVSTENVVVGREGWLFFAGVRMADDYQGKVPFGGEELRRWSEELQWRRDWLASKGIAYAFVIAPNKSTVYPEYLPRALEKRAGQSRREQLVEHLRRQCTAEVLDLTDALREAKSRGPLFFRDDSHWNGRGMWAAQEAIGRWLRNRIHEPGLAATSQWRLTRCAQYGYADLRCLLGLPPSAPVVDDFLAPCGTYRANYRQSSLPPGLAKLRQEDWTRPTEIENPGGKRRLLLFCDSFGRAGVVDRHQPLADLFALTSMFVLYPTRHEFVALVEQQRPDVVMESRAERSLAALPAVGAMLADASQPAGKTAALIGQIDDVCNPRFLFDGVENNPEQFATAPNGVPMVFHLKSPKQLSAVQVHLYDFDHRAYKFRVEEKSDGRWTTVFDCSDQARSGVVRVAMPRRPVEAFRITGLYNSDQENRPTNAVFHLVELDAVADSPRDADPGDPNRAVSPAGADRTWRAARAVQQRPGVPQ